MDQRVVSRQEWLAARKELLTKEKAATRALDELSAERRRLPVVEIDKDYAFEGPRGTVSLLDMFEGRRQLIVYHFMFDPEWDEGCNSCSFIVDNAGHLAHLHARQTSLALVSRAPLSKIEPFKARMDWVVPWYSSFASDFNYDFHVTQDEGVAPVEYNFRSATHVNEAGSTYVFLSREQWGLSVFLREGERVFHTYSTYGRGVEGMISTYSYLDLTPLGRQEEATGSGSMSDFEEGRARLPGIAFFDYHDGRAPMPGHQFNEGESSGPAP